MKTVDDKIADALGVENDIIVQETIEAIIEEPRKAVLIKSKKREPAVYEEIQQDYQKSRETIHGIIDTGKNALELALQVAHSAQNPRSFEVVGGLIKNITDATKELLETQLKLKELEKEDEVSIHEDSDKVTNIQNNNVYVGSTADLQKLLKAQREEHENRPKEIEGGN